MDHWQPTAEQQQQWTDDGFFIARGVIPRDAAVEVRGVIRDKILRPAETDRADADPMDPMGDSPAERAARFRKLSNYCLSSPLIWHTIHCGEPVVRMARWLVGDNLLLKFNSCFIKPARTGSATPWHQDNGLWRDGETEAFNFWMALDPATTENACLQFVPGSHRGAIVPHVLYEDSIHAELPRDQVRAMLEDRDVIHAELEPGDAVCWHSSLWHYSPVNRSEHGRIGIAGVYTTPELAERAGRWRSIPWVMRDGVLETGFPPVMFEVTAELKEGPGAFPKAS